MKANEFVKKFGWGWAKRVIELTIGNSWADHYDIKEDSIGTAGTIYSKKLCEHNDNFVCLRNLKRLVDSHELVSNFGGLKRAKRILKKAYTSFNTMISVVWNDNPFQCTIQKLEQAIADVESCQ